MLASSGRKSELVAEIVCEYRRLAAQVRRQDQDIYQLGKRLQKARQRASERAEYQAGLDRIRGRIEQYKGVLARLEEEGQTDLELRYLLAENGRLRRQLVGL